MAALEAGVGKALKAVLDRVASAAARAPHQRQVSEAQLRPTLPGCISRLHFIPRLLSCSPAWMRHSKTALSDASLRLESYAL